MYHFEKAQYILCITKEQFVLRNLINRVVQVQKQIRITECLSTYSPILSSYRELWRTAGTPVHTGDIRHTSYRLVWDAGSHPL